MPPGALGRLQEVAVHLAGIAGVCPPPAPRRPVVVVFAGDHGVVADGASAWPSEITAAMVATVSSGGAAISVFAEAVGAQVVVVDVGVQTPLDPLPGVRTERVANGTAARAGHRSSEPAASVVLDYLGLDALLDLNLRLGEGTGACLAFPLVQAAALALADMADLPEPGQA